MDFSIILGPLLGAVIGYFTNYIAVKMLFYPRHEVKIGGFTLPFTPGAIPKGKARLARSAGRVISEHLLTGEDLKAFLLSEDVCDKVALNILSNKNSSIKELMNEYLSVSDEEYEAKKETLCTVISNEMIASIDAKAMIMQYGPQVLKENASGIAKVFMSDKKVNDILENVGDKLQTFLESEGKERLKEVVFQKADGADSIPLGDLALKADIDENRISAAIKEAYKRVIDSNMDRIMAKLNIEGLVQAKIDAMSVEELEKLVLTMMKKELSTIVNLGALIGFVLGLLNLVIYGKI